MVMITGSVIMFIVLNSEKKLASAPTVITTIVSTTPNMLIRKSPISEAELWKVAEGSRLKVRTLSLKFVLNLTYE